MLLKNKSVLRHNKPKVLKGLGVILANTFFIFIIFIFIIGVQSLKCGKAEVPSKPFSLK